MVKTYDMQDRGGGQNLPPYLQGRSPTPGGQFQTAPMLSSTASASPAAAAQPKKKLGLPGMLGGGFHKFGMGGLAGMMKAKKPKTNAAPPLGALPPIGEPAAQQPSSSQTLYEFFKKDLENQRDSAIANARTDASARGVFYGTPLTTSQGDIQTEFGRGLGQLQAGILQNEQQNELQRLAIAAGLIPQNASGGSIDPKVWEMIGKIFGQRSGPVAPKLSTQADVPGQS